MFTNKETAITAIRRSQPARVLPSLICSLVALSAIYGCSGYASVGSPFPKEQPADDGSGGDGPVGSGGTDGSGAQAGDGSENSSGSGGEPSGNTLLDNPTGELPQSLKQVGIYPSTPDLSTTDTRAVYYEPRHALWSNGLKKARYMVLPQGEKIDTSVRDAWNFPVGTLFFKTFGYENAEGQHVPVETRLIRRVKDSGEIYEQWEFNVYEWNADGSDATLLDISLRKERQALVDGKTITHNIPQRADCWNCHIANKSPVIGFDELRLNSTLEGETKTQLDKVIESDSLSAAPPKPWIEIKDADPLQQQVFQYIQGNCVHCHNGLESLEPGARFPALNLTWDQLLKNTVNVPTQATGTASGMRIVPGKPAESILFLAVSREGDAEVKIMPLVGVDVVDAKAIEMLRKWITALKP